MSYLRYLESQLASLNNEFVIENISKLNGWSESEVSSGNPLKNKYKIIKNLSARVIAEKTDVIITDCLSSYVSDTWYRESSADAPTGKTMESFDDFYLGEINELQLLAALYSNNVVNPSRQLKKIVNLRDGVNYLFAGVNDLTLSVKLIKHVHSIIGGQGLIDNAGKYRQKGARPAGASHRYLPPKEIKPRLAALVSFIGESVAQSKSDIELLCIASLFLAEFLFIHPFSNGNGRTARLITNFILKKEFLVPFPLVSCKSDIYHSALAEYQKSIRVFPNKILNIILQALILHYDRIMYSYCMSYS